MFVILPLEVAVATEGEGSGHWPFSALQRSFALLSDDVPLTPGRYSNWAHYTLYAAALAVCFHDFGEDFATGSNTLLGQGCQRLIHHVEE